MCVRVCMRARADARVFLNVTYVCAGLCLGRKPGGENVRVTQI